MEVVVVEAEIVANLVDHGDADLTDELLTGGADTFVRTFEDSDDVGHHTIIMFSKQSHVN